MGCFTPLWTSVYGGLLEAWTGRVIYDHAYLRSIRDMCLGHERPILELNEFYACCVDKLQLWSEDATELLLGEGSFVRWVECKKKMKCMRL